MIDIKALTREELAARFKEWGEAAYRVDQVLDWVYRRRVTRWDAMTNVPKALRDKLRTELSFNILELVRKQGSRDTTQKFLWRLKDGSLIESVLIPANPALYGDRSDRHTLCVSTQVGCAYGCRFCASGLEGWKRNLGPEEIVEQALAVEREWEAGLQSGTAKPGNGDDKARSLEQAKLMEDSKGERAKRQNGGERTTSIERGGLGSEEKIAADGRTEKRLIDNLVIMGMGEPLANYDNLMKALRILNAPWGGGIGARKITVSTSGLAPKIRQLAEEPLQMRLAISLHGATDTVREKIMPVNRKYPLKELTAACEYYQENKGKLITFEYILIAGVNDGLDQTKPLAQLAKRLHAKINLIPYNKVEGLPWERPSEEAQEKFLAALERLGAQATLRREKGHDIDAACGQLRLKTEKEEALVKLTAGFQGAE